MGHERIFALLLEKGANDEARDFIGRTPEDTAKKNGQIGILKLFSIWEIYHNIPDKYLNNTQNIS